MIRIGSGYDVHKLVEGRKLIIGGVDIPHTMGLLGHSDADVLLHSISDALLGAAAMGDIAACSRTTMKNTRARTVSNSCAKSCALSALRAGT